MQGFFPNDRMAYPLYEAIAEEGVDRAVPHRPDRRRRGHARRHGDAAEVLQSHAIDDVAADFPDMTIILAHPSFPWQEEALAVATHKPNVYIDMSGWSPKYFPPILVQYANTLLKKKMLFGSDWPAITPDRWLRDFEAAPFRDEVRPLILKENARALLGL